MKITVELCIWKVVHCTILISNTSASIISPNLLKMALRWGITFSVISVILLLNLLVADIVLSYWNAITMITQALDIPHGHIFWSVKPIIFNLLMLSTKQGSSKYHFESILYTTYGMGIEPTPFSTPGKCSIITPLPVQSP